MMCDMYIGLQPWHTDLAQQVDRRWHAVQVLVPTYVIAVTVDCCAGKVSKLVIAFVQQKHRPNWARIRGYLYNEMRYTNLRFTYLLT